MKTLDEIRTILTEHRQFLQERYGVEELALFGSCARGEQSSVSDVDILVQVRLPIGLKFFELRDYLEEILDLKVDLLRPEALEQKPALWESVKEDLVYVRGGLEALPGGYAGEYREHCALHKPRPNLIGPISQPPSWDHRLLPPGRPSRAKGRPFSPEPRR